MIAHRPEPSGRPSSSTAQQRRVFFAALPDASERKQLAAALESYGADRETTRRLRWLDRSGWHVTLRFVGDVSAELIPQLLGCVVPAEAFCIAFNAIEPFPSTRRPRVLAATGDAEPQGHALVETLEARCRALSLDPDPRPWQPHLSLARIRGRRPLPLAATPLAFSMQISAFVLMESVPGPQGRRYVPIAGTAAEPG